MQLNALAELDLTGESVVFNTAPINAPFTSNLFVTSNIGAWHSQCLAATFAYFQNYCMTVEARVEPSDERWALRYQPECFSSWHFRLSTTVCI